MEREQERVMMNVVNAGRVAKAAFWINSPALMLTYTFLKRMVKEKQLSKMEFSNFEAFLKNTKGNYKIANMPVRQKGSFENKEMEAIKKTLSDLKIKYYEMPDLAKGEGDGFLQLAIASQDVERFSAWQARYLQEKMVGGEKEIRYLERLTSKETSMIDIPLEGKLDVLNKDFETLGINYAVLPDLKVGDGDIQLLVANEDLQKVQHWYKLYQEGLLKEGQETKEIEISSIEEYQTKGLMSDEAYIKTANKDLQAINETYNRDPGIIEAAVIEQHREQTLLDPEFVRLNNDSLYEKIVIDEHSLVTSSQFAQQFNRENKEFFASRIPSTWGNKEQTLILPKDQMFKNGNQYIGFMKKTEKPLVFDSNQKLIKLSERPDAAQLLQKYSKAEKSKVPLQVEKLVTKNVKPPVKVR